MTLWWHFLPNPSLLVLCMKIDLENMIKICHIILLRNFYVPSLWCKVNSEYFEIFRSTWFETEFWSLLRTSLTVVISSIANCLLDPSGKNINTSSPIYFLLLVFNFKKPTNITSVVLSKLMYNLFPDFTTSSRFSLTGAWSDQFNLIK